MSHDCAEHSVRCYPFRHPWRYFLAAGEVRGWWIVRRTPLDAQSTRIAELEAENEQLREAVLPGGQMFEALEQIKFERDEWKDSTEHLEARIEHLEAALRGIAEGRYGDASRQAARALTTLDPTEAPHG